MHHTRKMKDPIFFWTLSDTREITATQIALTATMLGMNLHAAKKIIGSTMARKIHLRRTIFVLTVIFMDSMICFCSFFEYLSEV